MRRLGTWQQNKSDSRSCDKSKTSSHLAAVHAVYELTYYFTWYTHSIPDEHRANKPLKDSCEVHKHWHQIRTRLQPSEMQIGNDTHLHRLKPQHLNKATMWVSAKFKILHLSTELLHSFGDPAVWGSTSLTFSSSPGKVLGCLAQEDECCPWSSQQTLTTFYIIEA